MTLESPPSTFFFILEAEMKFRLKWSELDYYMVYTKNYQNPEMLREQKGENRTSAVKSSLTLAPSAGGVGVS